MNFIETLREKAIKVQKTIVLPEGTEPRTLKATQIILEQKIAKPILIGNPEKINAAAKELGVKIDGARIVDPVNSEYYEDFVNTFYEMRKAKGVDMEKARKMMADEVYFATMMVKKDVADGLVSGAIHSTGDTIRPALQIIKTKPGIKSV
ncbi:phosphate acetyltransferase, partial [bacterium]|nr:phosphate acetyltransferase [bacterium]